MYIIHQKRRKQEKDAAVPVVADTYIKRPKERERENNQKKAKDHIYSYYVQK